MDNNTENTTTGNSGEMSKYIGYIVVLVIIIGGIVWYMNSKNGSGLALSNENASSSMAAADTSGSPTSLRALLSGGSQQCSFADSSTEGVQTSGTVYVANGKMRGDFTSTVSGKGTTAHMVMDGTYMYSWVDGMSTGFKMAMSATQGQSTTNSKSVDLDKPANITCSSWGVDSSKFQLPSSITFSDMSAMMQTTTGVKAGTGSSATANTAQCGYCDQLPADSKAQCRAALNCK